jgi:hypothetical protein
MTSPLITNIALRAYPEVLTPAKRKPRSDSSSKSAAQSAERWPDSVLVFDTETTVDETQRLLYGSFRYYRWRGNRLECRREGLFHADELPTENPAAMQLLQEFVRRTSADVVGKDGRLRLYSRTEFVMRVFYPAAYNAGALVVGFNLPFDLSRLAVDVGEGRGHYYGGFSLVLAQYVDSNGRLRENKFRPRVAYKHIDSKRSLIGFTGTRSLSNWYRGRFLDLKTLAFALSNTGHSLDSACQAFGAAQQKQSGMEHGRITPDYIEYNRQDVRATGALLERLREAFDSHPIDLDPCKALSPASIGKAYFRAMGITAPRNQFHTPSDFLGKTTTAYFGGRAETKIRNTAVPILYCDFLSMYPTVNALLGLWNVLTADSIELRDVTAEFQTLIDTLSPEELFDKETWRQFVGFVELVPDDDILPVRVEYAQDIRGWNIGLNHLTSSKSLWFGMPDVVAAALLARRPLRIIKAIRIVPVNRQHNLQNVKLASRIPVNPAGADFFKAVIEERQILKRQSKTSESDRITEFLKVLANSSSYGIFAQINAFDSPKSDLKRMLLWGLDGSIEASTNRPERPGEYCFPPVAALITAAARLMLALLEREVTDSGGSYVFCDTDSMAIVATELPRIIPCRSGNQLTEEREEGIKSLSWEQVEGIVRKFELLNPYDKKLVPGSILKVENENYSEASPTKLEQLWAYAISAKRYVLFNRSENGSWIIRKYSEHGLGHLIDPTSGDDTDGDWIREAWNYLVASAEGRPTCELKWLDRPALSRISISSHIQRLAFSEFNVNKPFCDQIKPGNFALSAHVAPFGHPVDADPTKFHLITPYTTDIRRWWDLPWTDIHSGKIYRVTTGLSGQADFVRIKSYRDILSEYANHPEPKSAGLSGEECGRQDRGVLFRRRIRYGGVTYLGKEANRLEEVAGGLVHDLAEVVSFHLDRTIEWNEVLLPWLLSVSRAKASQILGVSERSVAALRNGHAKPSRGTLHRLRTAVSSY